MTVVDSDYSAVIEDCRAHIANGTQPNGEDIKLIIAVVKDAADRQAAGADAGAADDAIAAFRAEWDTQIAILQAGGAGDISAEVDTAEAALDTLMTAIDDAADALDAAGMGADMSAQMAVLRTVYDAQFVILQAGGAGDIHAEVDTADAAIEAEVVALEATFAAPQYVTSTVADG